ncbi:transcription factor bHLH115-like isoform X2 [Trifolium pratense]|uniref:transcription factor bHLH115-like isoform X2 n=1 Tax=Trifolium pratense TaxID=57577 RepID=UPI001E6965B3|nr:transcription factor bHLH115-like isoform X2 [Trifolium pratense]
MDMDSTGGSSCWLYDYGYDISVAAADFMASDHSAASVFTWNIPQSQSQPQTHIIKPPSSNISLEMEYSLDSTVLENGPSKRLRTESYASGSKACREKLRRDKLNDKFMELSSVLEPDTLLPKTDKVTLLNDAVRVVTQLRNEAERLKERNDELREKVKELKAEKNELRDEKNKLKLDKEKLEQQVKLTSVHSSFLSNAMAVKGQTASANHKLMPFIGYPGISMWQFMSPATVDTSQDHLLRPPVA